MFGPITSSINNYLKQYKYIIILNIIMIIIEKSLLQNKKIICLMFLFIISTLFISIITAITFILNTTKTVIL